MNTMELTKIVAGLCASLLAFLLISWAAEAMVMGGGEAHGDEEHHHAYAIEMPEGDGLGEEEEVVIVQIADFMGDADVAAGQKVFNKCKSCHKPEEGGKSTGPYLYGVVGRDIGSVDGYKYSTDLTELEGEWTAQKLSEFLTDTKKYAPGSNMKYKLPDAEDRANLIAYLDSLDD